MPKTFQAPVSGCRQAHAVHDHLEVRQPVLVGLEVVGHRDGHRLRLRHPAVLRADLREEEPRPDGERQQHSRPTGEIFHHFLMGHKMKVK